jgi:hypothetical protein
MMGGKKNCWKRSGEDLCRKAQLRSHPQSGRPQHMENKHSITWDRLIIIVRYLCGLSGVSGVHVCA